MRPVGWRWRTALLVALGAGCTALGACQHRTLDGTVRVVGVAPFPKVLLMPTGGGEAVALIGPPALARVAGLEIAAEGEREGMTFRVERFTVVSANGVPVTDGRLVDEGGRLYLVTAGARHALVSPPPGLRAHAGRRVWVSGSLDREPVAYGLIE